MWPSDHPYLACREKAAPPIPIRKPPINVPNILICSGLIPLLIDDVGFSPTERKFNPNLVLYRKNQAIGISNTDNKTRIF